MPIRFVNLKQQVSIRYVLQHEGSCNLTLLVRVTDYEDGSFVVLGAEGMKCV